MRAATFWRMNAEAVASHCRIRTVGTATNADRRVAVTPSPNSRRSWPLAPKHATVFVATLLLLAAITGCGGDNAENADHQEQPVTTSTAGPEQDVEPEPDLTSEPAPTTTEAPVEIEAKAASSSVAIAAISGPIDGGGHGFPFTAAIVDLATAGYLEEEFFLTGTARSFETIGEWSADGLWPVAESSTAPFTTRLLVRRPADPDDFNGTVVVEWFNVSSNTDLDPDFAFAADELLRGGYAWVGVSAQAAGLTSSGGGDLSPTSAGLIGWDPERYGTLAHPGDGYSYDIFSQAGNTLLSPGDVDPLGGLRPRTLLADGESQSAFRLLTYVNAIHPDAAVFDGFLIHSRNGTGAPLGVGMVGGVPAPAHVRDDLDEPVLQIVTETDLYSLGTPFPEARQPDSDSVFTWEIAGTAHADSHYLTSLLEQGQRQFDDFLDLSGLLTVVNTAPQHLVMNAAIHALAEWARDGTPPGAAPPIETSDGAIARDDLGNALGGVRLPHVDAPVALVSGEGGIPMSGRTVPFDESTLAALYPDHATYVSAVEASVDEAVAAGHLLAVDGATLVQEARDSTVGGPGE